jgi:hypothetical protein
MLLSRDAVIEALNKRGANHACSRCGHNQFSLLDKYSMLGLQDELGGGLRLGGPQVPVALAVCNNCGAVTAHALGVLGLLPLREEAKDDGKQASS